MRACACVCVYVCERERESERERARERAHVYYPSLGCFLTFVSLYNTLIYISVGFVVVDQSCGWSVCFPVRCVQLFWLDLVSLSCHRSPCLFLFDSALRCIVGHVSRILVPESNGARPGF